MKAKIYRFTELKEKSKDKAIFEYSAKIDPNKSNYDIITEYCHNPQDYSFNRAGELLNTNR